MSVSVRKLASPSEIDEFWQKKREYEKFDIFPNIELEEGETLEEMIAHFNSHEYFSHLMKLHSDNRIKFVFFDLDGAYLGFAMYIIYVEEDGKSIILDFSIAESFRNRGFGKLAYNELAKVLKTEGGIYAALNTSNASNRKFWTRLGFWDRGIDVWGERMLVKTL